MKRLVFGYIVFFCACANSPQEEKTPITKRDTLQKTIASEAYAPPALSEPAQATKPKTESIKNPSGIYRSLMPFEKSSNFEHIVRFDKNHTYRLQERFPSNDNTDSVVITEGTWMPSNGFIWLYKEQLVQGRYKWKGDTLQYFNPRYNKNYRMHPLSDVSGNKVWKTKKEEGDVLYGIGNEPFWSVEYVREDTLSFFLSDWRGPLKMKITESKPGKDSSIFIAKNDSTQLKVTVLPYLCNDGMSDYIYRNKILVQYNNQTYKGCGILFKTQNETSTEGLPH